MFPILFKLRLVKHAWYRMHHKSNNAGGSGSIYTIVESIPCPGQPALRHHSTVVYLWFCLLFYEHSFQYNYSRDLYTPQLPVVVDSVFLVAIPVGSLTFIFGGDNDVDNDDDDKR